MVTDLVLELDYPFLDINVLEDVYINLALYKCFLLTNLGIFNHIFHYCINPCNLLNFATHFFF